MSSYNKDYYLKNKKKIIAAMVEYNRANKEKINARRKFNYKHNINGVRDKALKYRVENKKKYAKLRKAYYAKNKKRLIANMVVYNREYRKKNREKYLAQARVHNARRRAKLKAQLAQR